MWVDGARDPGKHRGATRLLSSEREPTADRVLWTLTKKPVALAQVLSRRQMKMT